MSDGSTVGALRSLGYAVVVISPEDLEGCEPSPLEDSLISYAWDAIEDILRAEVD